MAWQVPHRALLRVAFAAGLFAYANEAALAAEASYCVTCKSPDQTYLCRVSAGGAKASEALKLYCIIRTAKEGNHGSCSAERATPSCNGVAKIYSYDGPMPEDLALGVRHFTDKIKKDQKAFEKPKGDQPKTLVELTGRAFSASREGWRNARSRFGGTSENADQPPPEQAYSLDQSPSIDQSPVPLVTEGGPPPLAGESAPAPAPEESRPNRAQRASSAVGSFARKSYRCVVSFFRKCSEEKDAEETLR